MVPVVSVPENSESQALNGVSGKWDATSLGLERYTGYRSGLGRLR
jgi:hypothetical protein